MATSMKFRDFEIIGTTRDDGCMECVDLYINSDAGTLRIATICEGVITYTPAEYAIWEYDKKMHLANKEKRENGK